MAVFSTQLQAQGQSSESFQNPILAGFYPDPSICRVGDDYFMVNSSFEWYPGIPVHHSRDLVNWQQVGHALHSPSQLTIKQGMKASAGVWAPTIRYINGRYYVIVTAKQCGNMFYVSTDDPFGEWSEPTYLRNAPGIDPSLFCDDDGTVWLCANDKYLPDEMAKGQTSNEFIWVQQVDLEKGKLLGERHRLPHGLTLNSPATEAPHIYKHNGKYYLMTAEGMTWNNHAVAMFKADHITGPYEACNGGEPVFTHRKLPQAGGDITTTGHADIVETQNGEWWAVMLAVRPVETMNLLGRESFLCPVEWVGEELVFANGGRMDMTMKRPNLPEHKFEAVAPRDNFSEKELRLEWNFLRTPLDKFYTLDGKSLSLELRAEVVDSLVTPSMIARRVQSHKFNAQTKVAFTPKAKNEEAGLIIMQNSTNFYKFTIVLDESGERKVCLTKSNRRNRDIYETTLSEQSLKKGDVVLGIEGDGLEYRFYYSPKGSEKAKDRVYVGGVQDASVCASNIAGGFTGSYVGPYASSQGEESTSVAVFDWFEYNNLK